MTTFTEETALLEQIAQGDRESMRLLIDRYTGLVWSLVRRKISSTVDAEDLVQEIFAEVWKSAHRYKTDLGSEATFIAVIARRRIIDAIRKKTRHDPMASLDESIDVPDNLSGTSATPGVQDAIQILNSLNPQRRKVLELSIVRGLSHSQIVEATDLPLGTVKAHIRRGLEEIRSSLRMKASRSSAGGVTQ